MFNLVCLPPWYLGLPPLLSEQTTMAGWSFRLARLTRVWVKDVRSAFSFIAFWLLER